MYKKPYDDEFKTNAVEMLMMRGRPLKVLARELGVSPKVLRGWRDKPLGREDEANARHPRGEGMPTAQDLAAEIRKLQKENETLRRQRDILKKAMGIFSETSPGDMP